MTTIAWDGHILAVDSQSTSGSLILSNTVKKLYRDVGDYKAIAFAGALQENVIFLDWVRDGMKKDSPKFDGCAMCIDASGALYVFDGNHKGRPLKTDYKDANGTGSEIAMGAMDAGANAIDAVEIACKLDVYTGGKVHFYDSRGLQI